MTLQETKRRGAKVVIKRVGDNVTIMRPDGSETLNQYNKKDDTDITFAQQSADEYAYVLDENEIEANALGGRIDQHQSGIAVAHDSALQEEDRIDFPDGREFHVNTIIDLGTYQVAASTLDTS